MATKVLAGMAVQIVRVAALRRLNGPLSAPVHASNSSCSLCFVAAAAPRRFAAAGVQTHGGRSLRRWPGVRCMSGGDDANSAAEEKRRMPARLVQKQQLLDAAPAYPDDANAPIPKVSLEHVTLNFARSGGAGGQNVNKVNTKVDMRFNVMSADWLPERVRLKLLQMEKNRINGDGDLVVSSTRTRTQKGNIDDALEKIQVMIDAAAYVPPPPSEETKNKIQKLARIENERRLQDKKKSSSKKADRRNKGSWD
ncbi:unnamed protein product [Calypogeia fissa]